MGVGADLELGGASGLTTGALVATGSMAGRDGSFSTGVGVGVGVGVGEQVGLQLLSLFDSHLSSQGSAALIETRVSWGLHLVSFSHGLHWGKGAPISKLLRQRQNPSSSQSCTEQAYPQGCDKSLVILSMRALVRLFVSLMMLERLDSICPCDLALPVQQCLVMGLEQLLPSDLGV